MPSVRPSRSWSASIYGPRGTCWRWLAPARVATRPEGGESPPPENGAAFYVRDNRQIAHAVTINLADPAGDRTAAGPSEPDADAGVDRTKG